jgi:hypothetical protein
LRPWLHGELVGLGLLFQERLLARMGRPAPDPVWSGGLESLLRLLHLPVALPADAYTDADLGAMARALKAPGESLHSIPGAADVPDQDLASLLWSLRIA